MTASILRQLLRFSLAGATVSACLATSVLAQDASAWDTGEQAAVRLIAGSAPNGSHTPLRAGVEVKLSSGWKTYWRYPGDSGVPPRFDFSRSRNVKSVTVSWPAPHRFSDLGGEVIGYKGDLILPLRVVRVDPTQPADLVLGLDYAVCDRLCIPLQAAVKLTLRGGASAMDDVLAAAEARIPRPAALGEGSPAIARVSRDATGKRVTVEVAAPADMPVDLFVEGPTPDWALPLPTPIATATGRKGFAFDLDGLPPGASADGAELRFTLVSPAHALEVTHRIE